MEPTTTSTLRVPGAHLYYEVRGSGPVLLLICGGVYDAAGYAGLAGQLADRYTVVTYDRRGNSRSPLDGPPEPQRIEVHGDDAYRVLTAVGATADQPAYVFGNSSGAQIALELAARHPELVHSVVAHEPPVLELLHDREHWRNLIRDVATAFSEHGVWPAMQVFGAGMDMGGDEQQPPAHPDEQTQAMMARMEKNIEFFIGYEVPPFSTYAPDITALQVAATHVFPAVGVDSAGEPPYRATLALAERLGTSAVVFPGDHGGFGAPGEAFASRLHEVLAAV